MLNSVALAESLAHRVDHLGALRIGVDFHAVASAQHHALAHFIQLFEFISEACACSTLIAKRSRTAAGCGDGSIPLQKETVTRRHSCQSAGRQLFRELKILCGWSTARAD